MCVLLYVCMCVSVHVCRALCSYNRLFVCV